MNDLRNFDLNLLVVFEAIYSAGNISHAARQLNQTQPTVSKALGRLRELLDDPLFVREGRGVKPTQKAQQLIGPVQDALQTIRGGVGQQDTFDPATSKRVFKMVMLDHLEALIMPRIIHAIQDHRSVTIESIPISGVSMVDGLNDGSLDMGLNIDTSAVAEPELLTRCLDDSFARLAKV